MAGTGQARNQPVSRLDVTAESDDDTRPLLRKKACGRGTQAFAAAGNQRHLSVEHAHLCEPVRSASHEIMNRYYVTPAEAGVKCNRSDLPPLDSHFRGNDGTYWYVGS